MIDASAAKSTDASPPQDYREILRNELVQRQERNPGYSLRAFARDVKISPSMLSDVLKGHHGLSKSSAAKIAQGIGLSANEREFFCDLVESKEARSEEARAAASARLIRYKKSDVFTQLHMDTFQYIANWKHMAIIDLISFKSFRPDPKWIAKHLKITALEAEDALDRLKRLGILIEKKGVIESCLGPYEGKAKHAPSAALRGLHDGVLKLARLALQEQHSDEREISSAILAMDAEDMPYVKARMREFQRDLVLHLYKSKNKNKIAAFSMQFFKICDEELDS